MAKEIRPLGRMHWLKTGILIMIFMLLSWYIKKHRHLNNNLKNSVVIGANSNFLYLRFIPQPDTNIFQETVFLSKLNSNKSLIPGSSCLHSIDSGYVLISSNYNTPYSIADFKRPVLWYTMDSAITGQEKVPARWPEPVFIKEFDSPVRISRQKKDSLIYHTLSYAGIRILIIKSGKTAITPETETAAFNGPVDLMIIIKCKKNIYKILKESLHPRFIIDFDRSIAVNENSSNVILPDNGFCCGLSLDSRNIIHINDID